LDYQKRVAEGTVINNGSDVKIVRTKGPLSASPLFIDPKPEKKK
jgi:hypothetical protein